MKKLLSLTFLICFLTTTGNSQPLPWFQRAYGSSALDQAFGIKATLDGGYVLVGQTVQSGTSLMMLAKTDSIGQPVWFRSYGGTIGEFGHSVDVCTDGGFIMTGWGKTFGAGDDEIYLIKTDSMGIVEWARSYGGTTIDRGRCVIQTSDGGFAVAGHTNGFGSGVNDMMILKTDSAGNTSWIKAYGTTGGDNAWYIDETSDGGFVVTGNTNNGTAFINIPVLRLDANGDTLWTRFIGGASFSTITSGLHVRALNNGDIAIAGYTNVSGAGGRDALGLRLDSLGNLLWAKTYGGSNDEEANSVIETGSGNLIFAGYTESFGGGSSQAYTVATNSSGDTTWTKHTGGPTEELIYGADRGQGGGIAAAGFTTVFGGVNQAYLLKINGNTVCGENNSPSLVGTPTFSVSSGGFTVQTISPTTTTPTFQNNTPFFVDTLICLDQPSPCIPPVISSISAQDSICAWDSLNVSINGNLNDATHWSIYQVGCGQWFSGIRTTNNFSFTPAVGLNLPPGNRTILIRGEGGCVTPGTCFPFTVHQTLVDPFVDVFAPDSLRARQEGATYNWLDCESGFAPIGWTERTLPASMALGTHAVEITLNGCVDISACYSLVGLGSKEWQSKITLHPNPADKELFISGLGGLEGIHFRLFDAMGRRYEIPIDPSKDSLTLQTGSLSEGIYLIVLEFEGARIGKRFLIKR